MKFRKHKQFCGKKAYIDHGKSTILTEAEIFNTQKNIFKIIFSTHTVWKMSNEGLIISFLQCYRENEQFFTKEFTFVYDRHVG